MNINIGDKYLVPTHGNEPFKWNFECEEDVIEAKVIEPSIGVAFSSTDGVFWNNPFHGHLVLMKGSDGYFQWVPVDVLKPIVNNKPKYKLGDCVIVKENKYGDLLDVSRVGTLAYVTDVLDHGCQLALDPDCDPDEHSERSLFFGYEEFEPYKE